MPNFAMCRDDKCPSAETCQRHEKSGTKPDKKQEYWEHGSGRAITADDCVFYIPIELVRRSEERKWKKRLAEVQKESAKEPVRRK